MRRAAAVVLMLLVLSGCGASRRTMKSDTDATHKAATAFHIEADTTLTERTTTHSELSNDEQIVTEVIEFDTARPVDPATGTPPVKRKTRQTRKAATKAQQVTTTDTEAAGSSTSSAQTVEEEHAVTHWEEETRRGLNGLQQALCFAGASAIVGLVIWLAGRRVKRR